MTLIEIDSLTKRYGRLIALDDFSFKLEEGEIVGLLGRNGAGKTTAMKLILDLIKPTRGTIKIMAKPHYNHQVRRHLGFLPENPALTLHLSAQDALNYYGMLIGLDKKTRKKRIDMLLNRMGLQSDRKRRLSEFSLGMQQRISFSQAIMGEPKILILDEPTSGLDPIWRREIRSIIREMANNGCGVLLSSHILAEIELECDRVIIIDEGRILKEGKIDTLITVKRQYEVEVSEFKDSLINKIEKIGSLLEINGNKLRIELNGGFSPQDIIDIVNKIGIDIISISSFKLTFEEVFVDLLKEKEQVK
ncbi:MAG: ABC transporter ATP-binding protein [bacterium]